MVAMVMTVTIKVLRRRRVVVCSDDGSSSNNMIVFTVVYVIKLTGRAGP